MSHAQPILARGFLAAIKDRTRLGLGACCLVLAWACGGGGASSPASPASPVITSFAPASALITAGTGTTLTAVFSQGAGAVDQGLGAIQSTVPLATGNLSATTTFTLTVSNAAGTATSATVTVAVLTAPTIAVGPQSLTVTSGQPLILYVTANGSAPLAYQWQLNGKAITGATSASYTSPATSTANTGGLYTVVVSNAQGSVTSAAATLTVSATAAPVSVSVLTAATGLRLATGFAGFSYEKSYLANPLFNASNTALVALFSRLGPGILRVGGNSVDKTTWTPNGPGLTSGQIAPADLVRLAGFLQAANWKVIYGINFATNTTAGMAAEAASAAATLGTSLYGFELGNEPDLYHSNGLRSASYTFGNFLAEWQGYQQAILAQVPAAVFTGPASAYNTTGYTEPFAKAEGQGINLLTEHYYRANGQLASSTITLLLTPDAALPTTLQALKTAATGLAGGYRLAECNSFYNGGAPNVSDAYGTALWAIDFLFTNALNGSSGINFHGGGNSTGYTPIADTGSTVVTVRPEYYGMDLVTLAGPGNLLGTTVTAGGLSFSAYAVAADAGGTTLVLVNKDPGQAAQVTVDLGTSATSAVLTVLTGAGLNSPTGTLLNGAPLAADGSWTPGASASGTVSGSTLTLSVAPASAVLATIH